VTAVQTEAADGGPESMSTALNTISPKPIITHVVQSWRVQPGMVFAVAEDAEGHVWIVESTPVGTHCWTVEQAMELPQGIRTRRVLREAIRLGHSLQAKETTPCADDLKLPDMLPRYSPECGAAIEANKVAPAEQRFHPVRQRQAKQPVCA
jgi:hypothetical protein